MAKDINLNKVKDAANNLILDENMRVVRCVNIWSDGNKIRRFSGQNAKSTWHKPEDGYKKMIAVLIEVDEEIQG